MDAITPTESASNELVDLCVNAEADSTTSARLHHFLSLPENAHLEFKEARGNFSFDKLVQYVVAIANEGGGRIILGVTDRRPRKIVGTQSFAEPGRTEAGLFERLRQRVRVEELTCEERRVLIVHVPAREAGTVWEDAGVAWSRAGDALVPMVHDQRHLIYLETGDYSAEPCERAMLTDLDPAAIADFRSRWAKRAERPRLKGMSDKRTLIDAELMQDGKLTYAALILFGTHRAIGEHLPQAEVVFEYRSSEAAGPAQDRQEYRKGFFSFHDTLWERINLRNDKQSWQDGFFRNDIQTFDEKVTREAILNAICHREYRLGGSIFVRQFARRLEVVSPGGLPRGITATNILDEQHPRNRRLADSFARCGLVERAGQGLDMIFERTIRDAKQLPDFSRSSAYKVFLTLHGTMMDEAFVRFLTKVAQESSLAFTTHELVVLDMIHREEKVAPTFKTQLLNLREQGIIERVGRGRGVRYMLSGRFYNALRQRAAHPRFRGPDGATNKELLARYLIDQLPEGCPVSELRQVIPSLSRRAVQRLLDELRKSGRALLSGAGRGSVWLATKDSSPSV